MILKAAGRWAFRIIEPFGFRRIDAGEGGLLANLSKIVRVVDLLYGQSPLAGTGLRSLELSDLGNGCWS